MRRRTILAGGLLVFCLAAAANALTLSDLITMVRRNVRDTATDTTLQRYSDSVITDALNQGQREVINATWAISKSTTISTISGTTYYALPSDVAAIYRVTYEDANLPEVTVFQLDDDAANAVWASNTGTPKYFVQDKSQSGSIGVQPAPNTSAQDLVVYYYAYATNLSATTDEPFLGEDKFNGYHDLLAYWASYRICLIEAMFDKAAGFRQMFDQGVALMNANVGVKPPPVSNAATAGGHAE